MRRYYLEGYDWRQPKLLGRALLIIVLGSLAGIVTLVWVVFSAWAWKL